MRSSSEFVEDIPSVHSNQERVTQKKLLLIECEHYLNHALLTHDAPAKYQTKQLFMGQTLSDELKTYLAEHRPDMIVFYIGFVEDTELTAITEIRQHYDGLLMIVTNKVCEKEHFTAFDQGADDYLCRPVDNRILSKHIESLFQRQSYQSTPMELASISVGDICLQPQSQKCFVNGEFVKLTNFEFKLLNALIEHEGSILSRDNLYSSLLKRAYNGVERTLDVRMSQLREKLTVAGMKDNKIETVWGQGYMLSLITA